MLRVAFVALALVASMAAQQRRALLGTVVDGGGKPIASAEVQLTYTPIGHEAEPPVDRPTATTDARGRFHVDVLPGSNYQVWAIGPPRDARRNVSEITAAAAGQTVELRATTVQLPRTLKIAGLEQWSDLAPFTAHFLVDAIPLPGDAVPIGTDGTITLPATAAGQLYVDLIDKDQHALGTFYAREKQSTLSVHVPPPQEVPMRTFDDQGAAIADVDIEQRLDGIRPCGSGFGPEPPARHLWRHLGRSDANGKLVARIAVAHNPFEFDGYQQLFFVARKAGHALSYSGFTEHAFVDGKEVGKGLKELAFRLAAAKPFRARTLLAPDRPLGGQPVLVRATCPVHRLSNNGWSHDEIAWHTVTDADGRLCIDDVPIDAQEIGIVIEATATTIGLPTELARSTPPWPVVPRRLPAPPVVEEVLDLSLYHTLQLRVLDTDKGPARGTNVLILRDEGGDHYDAWTFQAALDSAGRLAVQLRPGRWLIFVRDAASMAFRDIDCGADQELTMALEPMPAMRGRVVDGKGQPIAGAQLDFRGVSMVGGGPGAPPINHKIALTMNLNWISGIRSDGDGNFVVCYLPLPNTRYEVVFHHGDRQSAKFQLDAGAEPVTIKIE